MSTCSGCSHVADVPGGTTRFIAPATKPGITACYRLQATDGTALSLFSPQSCVNLTTGQSTSSDEIGGSGSGSSAAPSATPSGPPIPCWPYKPRADVISSTALALSWAPPSENPKGGGTPPPATPAATPTPTPASTASTAGSLGTGTGVIGGGVWHDRLQVRTVGGDAGAAAASSAPCSASVTITGYQLQRQIGYGFADVTPAPGVNDTAYEFPGLAPSTQYCFRMRAIAATGTSQYTKNFCGTTLPASGSAPASAPAASDPVTSSDTIAPFGVLPIDPAAADARAAKKKRGR